ncbi:MAG: hypothetical protein WCG99_03940 [Candidatus Berkelbacteria bacterium]
MLQLFLAWLDLENMLEPTGLPQDHYGFAHVADEADLQKVSQRCLHRQEVGDAGFEVADFRQTLSPNTPEYAAQEGAGQETQQCVLLEKRCCDDHGD